MNSWEDGRYGGAQQGQGGGGYGGGDAEPTRSMPHVQRQRRPGAPHGGYGQAGSPAEPPLPPGLNPRGPAAGAPAGGYGATIPQQSSGGYGGGPAAPGYHDGPPPGASPVRSSRWPRRRKVKVALLTLLCALLVVTAGTWFWADGKLRRQDVLQDYPGRPGEGKGTNWLIVGSDSREGMTKQDAKDLHTGLGAKGKRTDSMMLLHIGDHGNTMMSIPRDSWVTVPAHQSSINPSQTVSARKHKINAAFAIGGAPLLVRTVETATGLHVDHYAEIGFAGFRDLVDSLGGVRMCLDKPMKDAKSGADFPAGCREFNGTDSLKYVRSRYVDGTGDLGRMKRQRQFLASIANEAASPATIANPFTLYPTISSGLGTLIVDKDCGLTDLASMFFAMKGVSSGSGKTITVPIANPGLPTSEGSAVDWSDSRSKPVFDALRNDTAVPDVK
ncbi:LCP family protein [Streptomyces sp. NPDC001380]|uniref:LCP family protein n=1 Tax=Streptomyces sp. NPDC001380 TaxID=3364566 RepID=UPI0036CCD925